MSRLPRPTVWLVTVHDHEEQENIGVYLSRDAAKAAAQQFDDGQQDAVDAEHCVLRWEESDVYSRSHLDGQSIQYFVEAFTLQD